MSDLAQPTGIRLSKLKQEHDVPSNVSSKAVTPVLKTSGVEMMALREHHCRWPLVRTAGDVQSYCGSHRAPNTSYCATHAEISYSASHGRPRSAAAR